VAKGLELKGIQVRPAPEKAGVEPQVDVAITVANSTQSTTYQLMAEPLDIHYEASTRTLFLSLSEPEQNPLEGWDVHGRPLAFVTLEYGETKVLHVSIPTLIKKIIPNGMETKLECTDISAIEHIACTIAHSERAFYPVSSETTNQMHDRLRAWGKKVSKTLDITLSKN